MNRRFGLPPVSVPQKPMVASSRRHPSRYQVRLLGLFTAVLSILQWSGWRLEAQCANPIVCENAQTGNPPSEWDIAGAGDSTLQGFATDISVNRGETVRFKVTTPASAFSIDIYRLGYYGGTGARKVATVANVAGRVQPACLTESATGLIDCGNWSASVTWPVPATAVSGIYLAKLSRPDTGGASHIVFIVRDDTGQSDLLFQTSDTTWQAYNDYRGNSLYVGAPGTSPGRAYKVSYNRPFNTRGNQHARGFLFGAEYPMVRWLEANGYDVSYSTGVDTDRRGVELLEHGAFLSVGQDEYWSAPQRTNVEAARAAGIHLAFFSGNEIFWKTRWENSVDGSNTPYRTLVAYKETHANAKTDPQANVWTGTWRDPRFSPPADGGRPENALSGTIFTVNCCEQQAIGVSGAVAGFRIWRNTLVAQLGPTQTAQIAPGIVGFEFDEDLDNGARPAGLVRLSSGTYAVRNKLQDYGSTYAAGTATHALTQYRHSSGARVFAAGTIRWSWALDVQHDGDSATRNVPTTPDATIQQATVNVLGDMGAQPGTLQPGLFPSASAADVLAPTSVITAPANGASVPAGAALTMTGTASDAGGGVVAGVEVSVNGGATWAPAVGQGTWTYEWTPAIVGPTTLRSRAIDDSGNIETPSTSVSVDVGPSICPCTIWSSSATPAQIATTDSNAVELGVKFRADTDGTITGVRFYKAATNTGTHTGSLWSSTGTRLATATFASETASGWQQVSFPTPVTVTANTTYVASYHTDVGNYAFNRPYFATVGVNNPPLHALATGVDGGNGVYLYGASGFPLQTFNATNYWVDVVFIPAAEPTPPTITSRTPGAGATGVSPTTTITATFSEAMLASTITSATFVVRDSANALITSSVSYNTNTNVATLTPSPALAWGTTYTVTITGGSNGVKDSAGNSLASDSAWSFTTAATGSACPCTIWNASATPAQIATTDASPIELGVKFRADTAGTITGVRFYKAATNTDTHTGSLWTNTGTLLARATFTGETASGWQQVDFATPVTVTANTTYVASYHTNVGNYAYNRPYFATAGVDNPPLHALATGVDGGNGVYLYGASGFPSQTFNATNYWVDVVITTNTDVTPPMVTDATPASGATGVSPATAVTATFSEPVDTATLTTSTFVLRNPGNAVVPGTVGYNGTKVVTLTPSQALAGSTTYTATITGGSTGVKDAAGNALASDYVWSFTTAATGSACPCTIWNTSATPSRIETSDTRAVELGVRFRADVNGTISGVRFYKGTGNIGTHIGNLWTNVGVLLATATFTNETASGWQQVTFSPPVALTANTTYIASYHTNTGQYAVDDAYFATTGVDNVPLHALRDGGGGGNGVYRYGGASAFPNQTYQAANYWVDVVFAPSPTPDTAPPTVVSTTPVANATDVSPSVTVTATFSETLDPTTVTPTTVSLRTAGNTLVPATVAYSNRVATLTPTAPLANASSYTATVRGGASGVKDPAGNALAADVTWTFTTVVADPCPCSIWTSSTSPGPMANDAGAVELGLKFRADSSGFITGLRFYKYAQNTGTHVGNLWTASGTLLGTATFANETAAGWQQVTFASPVAVTANTTYVASYHTDTGFYAATDIGFTSAVDHAPLHALASGASGGNGVYRYGANSAFPTQTFQASNYWVDVVFTR